MNSILITTNFIAHHRTCFDFDVVNYEHYYNKLFKETESQTKARLKRNKMDWKSVMSKRSFLVLRVMKIIKSEVHKNNTKQLLETEPMKASEERFFKNLFDKLVESGKLILRRQTSQSKAEILEKKPKIKNPFSSRRSSKKKINNEKRLILEHREAVADDQDD